MQFNTQNELCQLFNLKLNIPKRFDCIFPTLPSPLKTNSRQKVDEILLGGWCTASTRPIYLRLNLNIYSI